MAIPDIAAQSAKLSQLDLLYRMQDILNAYVIKNMLLIGQAAQAEAKTFINPNLYRLADDYYGAMNYWSVIANANRAVLSALPNSNFPDPEVKGTVTLLIPPQPSTDFTGGITQP